ncbi:serine/threonine-protein kinase [Chondromyces crocatus]|uniref:Protein kinase domain-containing protein n=1 Tax=Chondromyces crocatus TaxID=52 RepID=A0A0K1ER85_CHOCO|nr:serine/threonine-protein kinase [Chondromyces crocatus]AKT43113.1 uncharacterized protein CMC5_073410 [Chondromyces crocatus]
MTAPGDIVAGKFRLERLVGRGGMGTVWSGRHLRLDMPVAIKFMEAGAGEAPDARQRFEREARAAAQIRSPHVVQVLDHGVDDDSPPYIVMELLEGEDLGGRLRRVGRMSLEDFEPILTQAAKGLRRAHESGIVHRDLKPTNIFIAHVDDEEIVKLLDFGVAKVRWGSLGHETQTGTLLGSPTYMSPEQARGHRTVDHRSDLWSLGVIIFRAITGSKPFTADSIAELIIKVCIEPAPLASQFLPGLPPELDAFFVRAFQQDPDRRFQGAMEMAAEFSAIARPASSRSPRGLGVPSLPPPAASTVEDEPSSPSDPMPAEVFLQARVALEAAVSRTASLSGLGLPEAPPPLADASLPLSANPRSSKPALTTPTPQPSPSEPRSGVPSSPRSSVPSNPHPGPVSNPRESAPVLPVTPGEIAPPAFLQADAEVALYLAGGLGGPVAGAPLPPSTEPLAGGAQGPGAPFPVPAGPEDIWQTIARTLQVPPPLARRIVALGAVATAVLFSLLVVVVLLVGGSEDAAQDGGATPPKEQPKGDPPAASPHPSVISGTVRDARSTAEPQAPVEETPQPPDATPEQTPTETPEVPEQGTTGTPSTTRPAPSTRPEWKRPSGSTKKASGGFDLGY